MTTTGLVDLAAREADIAVRLTAKPPDYLVGREVLPLRHGVYGAPQYLKNLDGPADVILFRGNTEMPPWVAENYPDARVVLQIDDVSTMATAVRSGLGIARMPCFIGDSDSDLRRIDIPLKASDWGIWVLSHVDLRSTARVRVCREFLFDILQQQRALILGERSRYFG
jgi:DNA-binding transcriptional LysR family regulator